MVFYGSGSDFHDSRWIFIPPYCMMTGVTGMAGMKGLTGVTRETRVRGCPKKEKQEEVRVRMRSLVCLQEKRCEGGW